jgi:CheY-like chemotaxis protein
MADLKAKITASKMQSDRLPRSGVTTMKRVLLAEDSSTQALLFQRLLEGGGFEVLVANNGLEALEQIDSFQPNVILTDMDMPVMNGLELVEALQQREFYLPVVLMTAQGSEDTAMLALKAGATYFFPKRLLQQVVVPTLEEVVKLAEANRDTDFPHDYPPTAYHEYDIGNDSSLIHPLVINIGAVLKQRGFSELQLMRITMAMTEALTNAVNHGNLEVSSELRDNEEGPEEYLALAEKRKQEEPYKSRSVKVKAFFNGDQVRFVVRDQGPGFDASLIPDPTDPENLDRVSGRGLMLIYTFMDEVSLNKTGNEITMIKSNSPDEELDDDDDDDIFGDDD